MSLFALTLHLDADAQVIIREAAAVMQLVAYGLFALAAAVGVLAVFRKGH